MPDHQMMVGIRAWQQQVPIPQAYAGRNAWSIPLHPKMAEKPVSAKTALFRGAIALAVNGVPIFNPIKNDGRTDTFTAGELDNFGGHCGKGDDYHYHIGPVHLEKIVGKGNPIGYALDGYPLYGYFDAAGKEPKNLDAFNGRIEKDGYRYYSTKKYPYVNGGLRGVVSVVGNLVPRDMKALCDAFDAGDMKKAQALHTKLFVLCRDLLGLASNPIPIKAAMAMVGRDTGDIRLPLVPLEPPLADKLRQVLAAYGLPAKAC
jgi:hypothetical protein